MKMIQVKVKGHKDKMIVDTDSKALLLNEYMKLGYMKMINIDIENLEIEILTDDELITHTILN